MNGRRGRAFPPFNLAKMAYACVKKTGLADGETFRNKVCIEIQKPSLLVLFCETHWSKIRHFAAF